MLRQDVLKHPARVLTQAQRERYFRRRLPCPSGVRACGVARAAERRADELMERSRRIDAHRRHLGPRARAFGGGAEAASHYEPAGPAPCLLGILLRSGDDRPCRRYRRPRRQVPPRQAQREVGARHARLQVASGHSGVAAHRLQPGVHRHLHRRLHAGAGPAQLRARQPRGAAFQPVRPRWQLRRANPRRGPDLAQGRHGRAGGRRPRHRRAAALLHGARLA